MKAKVEAMYSVSLSFYLWMRRGCESIFGLIAHGIDKNFKRHQVHDRMLECSSTKGVYLVAVPKPKLEMHNLIHKVTVKDGRSNLRRCTQIICGTTDWKAIGLDMCFDGVRFAHILRGACNSALRGAV